MRKSRAARRNIARLKVMLRDVVTVGSFISPKTKGRELLFDRVIARI